MYHSVPWEFLLRQAFGVQSDQIKGPGWMINGFDSYDVNAIIPPGTTAGRFRMMLQNLLVERFHLVHHRESKAFPGYELTVAPGGPKLRRATLHAETVDASNGAGKEGSRNAADFPVLAPGQKFAVKRSSSNLESGMIRATFRESIPEFLEYLPYMIMNSNREAGYPRYRVVDRTGLEGVFEFNVEYFGGPTMEAGGPSIFQALEYQLGLKLIKSKDVRLEVIVVDSAQRIPTEN